MKIYENGGSIVMTVASGRVILAAYLRGFERVLSEAVQSNSVVRI
jgi:septal ring factor EnvC (AmiA/AmiB activator)